MAAAGPELPSLDDVVRQHFGARREAPVQDPALRRLKADHLKARGDEAIKDGNYRLAWERYSEAIELLPGKEGLHTLHSNRSLAYYKAQRYSDALADADAAAALAPRWPKAHWRRAAALLALKRAPEAVLAYREAWRLDRRDAEGAARLWGAVQRLTREQLARGVLGLLSELQEEGKLEAPQEEEATEGEQTEALFRRIKQAHREAPRPGPWYRRYLHWLQEGIPPAQAYSERSAVHCEAKCYLQALADARAAIALLLAEERAAAEGQQGAAEGRQQPGTGGADQQASGSGSRSSAAERCTQLAVAYQRLGQACMAEEKHPDRDCRGAAKAFMRAQETLAEQSRGPSAFSGGGGGGDSSESELVEAVRLGLEEASKELTVRQLDEIQLEIYHEGTPEGTGAGATLTGLGAGGRLAQGQRAFRVSLRLAFPGAKAADCSSRARELLRAGVAEAAGVDPLGVTIERITAPNAARGPPHLLVHMAALVGADLLKAASLAKAVTGRSTGSSGSDGEGGSSGSASAQGSKAATAAATAEAAAAPPTPEQLAEALGGQPLVAALGLPDPVHCTAEIEDVTPACAASAAERAQQEVINRGEEGVAAKDDRRLAHPVRPKMELELPYKLYKLVKADGSLVERVDKHPFCMSRVYYDATEKPEEVWAELADGSCRWRQTGGEVKILALRVPQQLPSKHLAVDIEPYSIKVWNRASGEVYLEGELERGVVPEDCFWTHCGGEGEDGCALYLRKMNLELLQKHWVHSEMWWPRLFRCHGEIAWDDYEKDYSDLPEEVLARHRVNEAIQDKDRQAENEERTRRGSLQERDDMRKRARQERLAELRTGVRRSWVHLRRGLPAEQSYITA